MPTKMNKKINKMDVIWMEIEMLRVGWSALMLINVVGGYVCVHTLVYSYFSYTPNALQ